MSGTDEFVFLARVYINGETLYTWRLQKEYWYMDSWRRIAVNDHRASSVFVDCEHIPQTGFLNDAQVADVTAKLRLLRDDILSKGVTREQVIHGVAEIRLENPIF